MQHCPLLQYLLIFFLLILLSLLQKLLPLIYNYLYTIYGGCIDFMDLDNPVQHLHNTNEKL